MFERLVRLVATVAFAGRQTPEVDWMLEWSGLYRGRRVQRVIDHGVADIAIICNDLACVTDVFAIMATEATGKVEMPYVIGMCLPIGFHLREKVSLKNALNFAHGSLDQILFLRVHVRVLTAIKVIQPGINLLNRSFGGFIMPAQKFNRFAFEIR